MYILYNIEEHLLKNKQINNNKSKANQSVFNRLCLLKSCTDMWGEINNDLNMW